MNFHGVYIMQGHTKEHTLLKVGMLEAAKYIN